MKKFSKERIDFMKKYFVSQRYPLNIVQAGNREVDYFILPKSLNEDLPHFVYRCTGELSDGYVIGISDGIPAEFRPYFAMGEYIEFMEKGIDTPGRVVSSEREVLRLVPKESRPKYSILRRDFFKKLLECNKKKPEIYLFSNEDIVEFQENLNMLEKLVGESGK